MADNDNIPDNDHIVRHVYPRHLTEDKLHVMRGGFEDAAFDGYFSCYWLEFDGRLGNAPGGHFKFPHLWPGQNPPGGDDRYVWIVTPNRV